MHELSICKSIVEGIISELHAMDPRPKRLVSARIMAGELRQIVPEFMQEAYRAVTKDTEIEGSQLDIEVVPIIGICKDCDWNGDLTANCYECGSCGSKNLKVEGGMELYLDNLEIEK